jgi:hypothetical protein
MQCLLTEHQIQALLDDLCRRLGICLPPSFQERLKNSPPTNALRFAEVVYRAEGLDPTLGSELYKAVLARVEQAFAQLQDNNYSV